MKWKVFQSCGLHVRGYPETHQQRHAYIKQHLCGNERQDDRLSESIQHKLNMTDLDHRRTRFNPALIVFTMAPIPPMPRVCALNHPEFRQRCEAL